MLSDAAYGPSGHARGSAGLVVISNRLPVRLEDEGEGPRWHASPGGLVSALTPVLRGGDGVWGGWSGHSGDIELPATHEGIALHAVPISNEEFEDFYLGFANRTLWPLYHDAIRTPSFERRWWQAYLTVNRHYTYAVADVAGRA